MNYRDLKTGFVTQKSKDGKDLKAQEQQRIQKLLLNVPSVDEIKGKGNNISRGM